MGNSHMDRLLGTQYKRLADAFHMFSQAKESGDSVIDLRLAPHSLTEQRSPQPALDAQNMHIWVHEITPPGLRSRDLSLIPGQERLPNGAFHLPYSDAQFDWSFCSDVIEQVGDFEKQYALVKELARVSRKGAFITASNRNHPLEFHTGLPFLHWLPEPTWRRMLKRLGRGAWASESVLSLLDANALYRLARLLPGKPRHDVGHKRLFGIKAHFFLMIEKPATPHGMATFNR